MKKKVVMGVIVLLLVMLVIVFLVTKKQNTESEEIKYKDVQVSTMTIENNLTSSGEVTNDEAEISLNTNRYLSTLYSGKGTYYKKGSKIIKYTNGTYYKAPYDLVLIDYNLPDAKEKIRDNHYLIVKRLDSLEMDITIDETDISKVAVNQVVNVSLNAFENKTYEGKITFINQIGSYSSSGTKYTATVKFSNDGDVKLGMGGSVSISVEKAENVIAVPIEAVQTKNNEKYVLVVDSDGNTGEVTIETGISNSAYVEVKSGLEGNETIRMIDTSSDNSIMNMFGSMNGGEASMGEGMESRGERPEGMPSNRSNTGANR